MEADTEKYYRSVALKPKDACAVERERTHARYTETLHTGRLSGELVALQPLHVGSGLLVPPDKLNLEAPDIPLVKAWTRSDGKITLPGSSLKGALRSLIELFTLACVCKTGVRDVKFENHYRECRYDGRGQRGNLCPACRLFGAMGYEGQVRALDAALAGGTTALHALPPQYQPRADERNPRRRYYPHALVDPRGDRNWPLEVVQPGGRFPFEVDFTNLSAAEVGLLLIALGQGPWALCPKIGAGKSCGLGAVCIEALEAETLDVRAAYTAWDVASSRKALDLGPCIQAAEELYQARDLEQLAADLAQKAVPHG